jgi:hypothetical protein
MILSLITFVGWFGCMIICYYVIRPNPNKLVRIVLTLFLCTPLSYITCQNLPQFKAFSILTVAACWLTSIRLIHLTVFAEKTLLSFQSFLLKIVWIVFPFLRKTSSENQWPLIFQLLLIVIKLLINHWIYRWSMNCDTRVSCARILMFYVSIVTVSYLMDAGTVLVRILTRDKFTLESFTNFPIFSLSLREFWGQRYNRIVNTILKESVFQPIRLEFSSSTVGGLTTFIVSGLIHVHVAFVTFNDTSSLFPTFMFFLLHGIACSLEANMKLELSEHVGWLLTHIFLLITAPLMLGSFIKEGSQFSMHNQPPLFNAEWIPKLPIPNFCPQ